MSEVEEEGSTGGDQRRRPPIDVWVGTNLGLLKGVSLVSGKSTSYMPGSMTLSGADKSREVCAMCWEGGVSSASTDTLYCALRNGRVQKFGCEERVFSAECDCSGDGGVFVGLGRHERVLITCTDNGRLSYWPDEQEKTGCLVGSHASCMAVSSESPLLVATGGKENDLKLWDSTSLIFQAKNVRNDKLDLRVPVWVTAVDFIPGGGAQPTVAVGTGYHQVRLYDSRAQRRPVYSHEFGDSPITALTVTPDGRSYLVGNSVGELARIDSRTGKVVNHYKGFAGAVKSIQCSPSSSGHGSGGSGDGEELVAACGLDRYLRVYSVNPPKLKYQVYLKLQSSCLLFSNESSWYDRASVDATLAVGMGMGHKHKEEPDQDSDEDEMWNGMETVGGQRTQSKRRKNSKNHTQNKILRTS